MCYSAGASLVASGGLATVGIASYKTANDKNKIVAAIPIIFALQQAFEGFQWIAIGNGKPSMFLAYAFLFFAFLFWPIYIPIVTLHLDQKRSFIIKPLLYIGIIVALVFLLTLLLNPLAVYVRGSSICYDINVPMSQVIIALYVFVTTGVLLVSSKTAFRWFGLLVLFSAILAEIFFFYTFTSVWCFFAALLSSLIYLYVKYPKLLAHCD